MRHGLYLHSDAFFVIRTPLVGSAAPRVVLVRQASLAPGLYYSRLIGWASALLSRQYPALSAEGLAARWSFVSSGQYLVRVFASSCFPRLFCCCFHAFPPDIPGGRRVAGPVVVKKKKIVGISRDCSKIL